jgi:hypothetical protein
MSGPLPTGDGGIVISHARCPERRDVVWVVLSEGQQEPSLEARENRGDVLFDEVATGTWMKVS